MIGGRKPRGIGSSYIPGPARHSSRRWWGGRRHDHLHFETKKHSRRRSHLRHILIPVAVVIVLLGAASIRALTAPDPDLATTRAIPAAEVLSGRPPAPAWPATGQAAVEVEGLPPLGSSGGEEPVPIASLTKIMTAYVVLQAHPLAAGQNGFTITVTPADVADYDARAAQAQSVVPVIGGETLTELQLLEGLLVPSANNFAEILASHSTGSTTAFVTQMNDWAARLGMTHTTYTDPAGLAATTVSTATDQLILAGRAMADPVFAQIVAMPSVFLPVVGAAANFNTAVGHNGYVGIKTGSDSTAGGCLAFANVQPVDGRKVTILGVVLGQDTGAVSTPVLIGAAVDASNALVASVRTAVAMRTVLPQGSVVAVVHNAQGHRVDLTTASSVGEIGYGGEQVPLSLSLRQAGRTLRAQEQVGRVSAGAGGPSSVVVAGKTMPAVTFSWKLLHDF